MSTGLEYDERVRYSTLASIARSRRNFLPLSFFSFFVSLIFVSFSLISTGLAQNSGSSGGGHSGGGGSTGASFSGSHAASGGSIFGFSGPGSSGSHGSGSGSSGSGSGSNHGGPHSNPPGNPNGNHPHHPYYPGGGYAGSVFYAVPYPYVEDDSAAYDDSTDTDTDTDDSDADYQGGPTVFDRRGSGADSYVPPVKDDSQRDDLQPDAAMHADADEAPQEPTVLVFKDGHQIEVNNYAIVGVTLFDLTPGHARRVALADLDLEATQKRNDDRGVVFVLPASSQAN
jgi:hypothetical protein